MDSYTQHMPVLQRTTFWSNYMSGLKGSLAARDKVTETVLASPFSQYRAVDVTMYDLIYGEISSVSSFSSHLSPCQQAATVIPGLICPGTRTTGLSTPQYTGGAGLLTTLNTDLSSDTNNKLNIETRKIITKSVKAKINE